MSGVQNISGVSVRCQFPTWGTLLTLVLRLFPIWGAPLTLFLLSLAAWEPFFQDGTCGRPSQLPMHS